MATETLDDMQIILASSSPRRRELMAQAGLAFTVVQPPIPEPNHARRHLSPAQQAEAMAFFKASTIAARYPQAVVIGADTVVAVGGEVLGKPADAADARRMLGALSGTRHAVITAVAMLAPHARLIASDVTHVTMRDITRDEIESYITSKEWQGKAGAYAIQETADRFVARLEGSFTNVVGLPMELLNRMLKEIREHAQAHRTV